ncbi:MAG: heparinase II/III family protein [Ignavibacteria bacterium]|nr:heparinase II/III family protein [Ignavibacteria bacterium]
MKNLWKLKNIPISIAIKKAIAFFKKKFKQNDETIFFKDFDCSKIPAFEQNFETGYFSIDNPKVLEKQKEKIIEIGDKILSHKFNLLGTGWISRNFSIDRTQILDFLPELYKVKAKRIFENLDNYKSINYWQEPNTKFIWLPKFYTKYRIEEGNDVKQAWELGRMQHLPILALCYLLEQDDNQDRAKLYLREFESQILDFIATNPLGYSIQWKSAMEVSIRFCNWLATYDLFKSARADFSSLFETEFKQSIYEHILFVLKNLEWSEGLRGNHYYANIVSLIFAGCYLPISNFSAQLLAFGIQELIDETLYQFLPDGGNFECSIFYHIQVVEMLLISLYLISCISEEKLLLLSIYSTKNWKAKIGLRKKEKQKFTIDFTSKTLSFPKSFLTRINQIIRFTNTLKKPNLEFEQIGDNDSGLFLRLNYFLNEYTVNSTTYDNLSRRELPFVLVKHFQERDSDNFLSNFFRKGGSFRHKFPPERIITLPEIYVFKHFGLAVVKSVEYLLTFRCGDIGQKGKGGHSHNDQLSITLNYSGEDFIVDPGTFCYTFSMKQRNKYRSVRMHNTLIFHNLEQNLWKEDDIDDVFWTYKHQTRAKFLEIEDNRLVGIHFAYPVPHRREIKITSTSINFVDFFPFSTKKRLHLHLHPNVLVECKSEKVLLESSQKAIVINFCKGEIFLEDYEFSPQYGVKLKAKRIVFLTDEHEINWEITFNHQIQV